MLSFCLASHEVILIITQEPTSLTDGYSMIKALKKHQYNFPVNILFNQVASIKQAQKAWGKLKNTVSRHLKFKIDPLGIISSDKTVHSAIISQTPFMLSYPDTSAARCISALARKLIEKKESRTDIPIDLFWKKCLSFFNQEGSKKSDEKQISENLNSQEEKTSQDPLSKIEHRLDHLTNEICELKDILKTLVKRENDNDQHIVPWSETKRITREAGPDSEPLDMIQYKFRKRHVKPIARGKLRIPTTEELENWDDANHYILENRPAG